MNSTAIVTDDTAIVSTDTRRFDWGAAIASAIAATAVAVFLLTLGSGIGLAVISPHSSAATFLTLGAIYVFAAQAFAFAVGGYLVGRLIGPEGETTREEEFIAASHGLVVWALVVVASLVIANFTAVFPAVSNSSAAAKVGSYWIDTLFYPAPNTAQIVADKAEVSRIWALDSAHSSGSYNDDAVVAGIVARDVGISANAAYSRVGETKVRMRQDLVRDAKAASYVSLWIAFSLLFGAIVAVAAAISARWMDDKVSFSFATRWK